MSDLSLLAKTIREARQRHHYSQSGLAIRCNLTPSYISKIENNQVRYAPSREAIASLATILEIDRYRLSLMARHVPEEMLDLVCKFLLAYPKERAKEILEEAFFRAVL